MRVYALFNFHVIFFVEFIHGSVILQTKQGVLKGELMKSRSGRSFASFYGIPYAEPPLKELRFKDPVPAKSWEGIRDCTILPPPCIQYDNLQKKAYGDEDCLYLNLYKPEITNATLLPVMVLTHGGRFLFRDGLPDKYGPQYFMDKDVILITYQYRLGVLGFLSTEDEIIPGNYGLKDGVEVLRWVQHYIDDFGGDKNRVTIFGASSGGISVSMYLVSPIAQGLFHRVISQSGHPFDLEPQGKARSIAWKLGSMVGCHEDEAITSEELLHCLKKIPAEKFVFLSPSFYTLGNLLPVFTFGPVIENEKVPGAFLVDSPSKLLGWQSNVPWLMGMNSHEGGMMALLTYRQHDNESVLCELDTNYKKLFPEILRYEDRIKNPDLYDSVTETFKNHFFGEKKISQDIHAFSKMFTIVVYLQGIKDSVKLYKGPKYVYYNSHKNNESLAKTFYDDNDLDMGVVHGDELFSLFNWSCVSTPITEGVDLKVSQQFIDLWTNFAANGDPNYKDEIIWNPVDSPRINYLYMKDGILEMRNELLEEESRFLDTVPIYGLV